jgi:hypothetical protein
LNKRKITSSNIGAMKNNKKKSKKNKELRGYRAK